LESKITNCSQKQYEIDEFQKNEMGPPKLLPSISHLLFDWCGFFCVRLYWRSSYILSFASEKIIVQMTYNKCTFSITSYL